MCGKAVTSLPDFLLNGGHQQRRPRFVYTPILRSFTPRIEPLAANQCFLGANRHSSAPNRLNPFAETVIQSSASSERELVRVCIIGCGHVGLVTGGCLAAIGHHVFCLDRDAERIQLLGEGRLPVYEPHLHELILGSRSAGMLTFTTDVSKAIQSADIIFLCIGVPQLENGKSDFAALDAAANQIAHAVDTPKLIVERSTVPVKTGEQLKHLLSVTAPSPSSRFHVAANPQFLRKGTAVEDFFHPERILLGADEPESEATLRQLYAPILQQNFPCPIHPNGCPSNNPPELLLASVRSAELIKQASNAFLAVKISYANVLADLCEQIGADVQEVTHAVGLDPRIRKSFLQAGIGFGGDRLPKDLRAFCGLVQEEGVDAGILRAAEDVNSHRVAAFFQKINRALWVLKDKKIALLGLSHKADTDDIRGSPAIELYKRLVAAGARVSAFDPQAISSALAVHPGLASCSDPYAAAERADALLLLTEWEEFRVLDWQRIRDTMARPLVLDGRNLLSPAYMKSIGFEYHSVGRPD
jgi:UDPglucose 6-dehydrogenase